MTKPQTVQFGKIPPTPAVVVFGKIPPSGDVLETTPGDGAPSHSEPESPSLVTGTNDADDAASGTN